MWSWCSHRGVVWVAQSRTQNQPKISMIPHNGTAVLLQCSEEASVWQTVGMLLCHKSVVFQTATKKENHDVNPVMSDSFILQICASVVAVWKCVHWEGVLNGAMLENEPAAPPAAGCSRSSSSDGDVTLKAGTLFETMDRPGWCSTGEGSQLALLISAADGIETWPLSAEQHPS